MRAFVVLVVLVLSGCIPDSAKLSIERGRWHDYHDMMMGLGHLAVEKDKAPDEVKERFAKCFADYVVKAFTPTELQRLDAYARGDTALTAGELRQLDDLSNQRTNGSQLTNETLNRFDTTCPNDVPDFRRYLSF